MTEHSEKVERQRLLLEAEEWANGVKDIHVHSLSSMWYDNRPEDTAGGKNVTDTAYNNGVIVRQQNGKVIHRFGKALKGDDLINEYQKKCQPSSSQKLIR